MTKIQKESPRHPGRGLFFEIDRTSSGLTAGAELGRAQDTHQSQTTPQRSREGNDRRGSGTDGPLFEAGVAGIGDAKFRIEINVRTRLAGEEAVLDVSKHIARAAAGGLGIIHANELVTMGPGVEVVDLCGTWRRKGHGGSVETSEGWGG